MKMQLSPMENNLIRINKQKINLSYIFPTPSSYLWKALYLKYLQTVAPFLIFLKWTKDILEKVQVYKSEGIFQKCRTLTTTKVFEVTPLL